MGAKIFAENLYKPLYPDDEDIHGEQFRLEQHYFSCSSQDTMIRSHIDSGHSIDTFHRRCTIQLNDTHPSVGVAELMRAAL